MTHTSASSHFCLAHIVLFSHPVDRKYDGSAQGTAAVISTILISLLTYLQSGKSGLHLTLCGTFKCQTCQGFCYLNFKANSSLSPWKYFLQKATTLEWNVTATAQPFQTNSYSLTHRPNSAWLHAG